MSKLTALFAATTLVTGVSLVYLWQQLHDAREQVAQMQRERYMQPGLSAPAPPATEPGAASQAAPPAAPPGLTTSAAPLPARVPTPMPGPMPAEVSQALARINQTAMSRLYPDLDKALGLNPEEANSLVQLLMRNAPQAEIDALIGPVKAQELQDFQKTIESRRRMNDLKVTLAQSSFPLTDAQVDRLGATSRAEQVRRDEDLRARIRPTDPRAQLDFDEETIRATEASYGRVIAAARSVLSPEQLGIMQNSMNSVVASQRINLQTRRARLAAGGYAESAPTPSGSSAQGSVVLEGTAVIITQPDGRTQAVQLARP
jgi:hypothetical protein